MTVSRRGAGGAEQARALLGDTVPLKDAIAEWANLGAFVHGLHTGDFALIARSLEDTIAEPHRALLIPGLAEIKLFGKPIVFGPHMQNFREIAETFIAHGAAVQVSSDRELDDVMLGLVRDPVHRASLGAAARALVEANRGAKDKTLAVIGDLLPPAGSGGVVRPFRLVQ